MKKITSLFLIAALLFCLAGCSKHESSDSPKVYTESAAYEHIKKEFKSPDNEKLIATVTAYKNETLTRGQLLTVKKDGSVLQEFDISNCELFISEFAYFKDVTFDGTADLLVPYRRNDKYLFFKAFVWSSDQSKFIFAPYFETIPNFIINNEEKRILAHSKISVTYFTDLYTKYTFDKSRNDFVVTDSLLITPNLYADSFLEFTEKTFENGNLKDKKTFSFEIEGGCYTATKNLDYADLLGKDKKYERYIGKNSFWDLLGEKWKTNLNYTTIYSTISNYQHNKSVALAAHKTCYSKPITLTYKGVTLKINNPVFTDIPSESAAYTLGFESINDDVSFFVQCPKFTNPVHYVITAKGVVSKGTGEQHIEAYPKYRDEDISSGLAGHGVSVKYDEKLHSAAFLVDAAGKKISKNYDHISNFYNGMALIFEENRFGVIADDGTVLLEPSLEFDQGPYEDNFSAYMPSHSLLAPIGGLWAVICFDWDYGLPKGVFDVLDKNTTFYDEHMVSSTLNSYRPNSNDVFSPQRFAVCDIDGDKEKELLISDKNTAACLAIDYSVQSGKICGHYLPNGLYTAIKKDGSFATILSAKKGMLGHLKFNEWKKSDEYSLIYDFEQKIFSFNGKKTDESFAKKYLTDWINSEELDWVFINNYKYFEY